jgi:hypothetical protein
LLLALPACTLAVPTPTPAPTAAPAQTARVVTIGTTPAAAATPVLPQPRLADAPVESPEWRVLGFLDAWQRREFAAMGRATVSNLDRDDNARTVAMMHAFDFRPLKGAEIISTEPRGTAAARVEARVWYEFPPGSGQVQRKRLGLMLERDAAPRTAATGPNPWRINAASTAGMQDDP